MTKDECKRIKHGLNGRNDLYKNQIYIKTEFNVLRDISICYFYFIQTLIFLKYFHILVPDEKADLNILVRIDDSIELLKYMKGKYLCSYNVAFAQTIFWVSESFSLYNICLVYAKDRRNKVIFVEIETVKGKTHTETHAHTFFNFNYALICFTKTNIKHLWNK